MTGTRRRQRPVRPGLRVAALVGVLLALGPLARAADAQQPFGPDSTAPDQVTAPPADQTPSASSSDTTTSTTVAPPPSTTAPPATAPPSTDPPTSVPPTTATPAPRLDATTAVPPSLALLKRPVAGPPAGYAYEVTGSAGSSFRATTVTDPACTPAPVEGDTNLDGLLNPGEMWLFRCTTDAPIAAGSQATASASDAVTAVPVTATAIVPLRRMALVVVADRTTVHVSDTVHYAYLVSNTGRSPLLSVSVVDDRRGPITLGVTTLAPGTGAGGTSTSAAPADQSGTVAATIAVARAVTADSHRVNVRARVEVTVLPADAPDPPTTPAVIPQPLLLAPANPPITDPTSAPKLNSSFDPSLDNSFPDPSLSSSADPSLGSSSSDPLLDSSFSDPSLGDPSFDSSFSDPSLDSSFSDPSLDGSFDSSGSGVDDGFTDGQAFADAALADTGVNAQRPLDLGITLIVLGAALVIWERRRRVRTARSR